LKNVFRNSIIELRNEDGTTSKWTGGSFGYGHGQNENEAENNLKIAKAKGPKRGEFALRPVGGSPVDSRPADGRSVSIGGQARQHQTGSANSVNNASGRHGDSAEFNRVISKPVPSEQVFVLPKEPTFKHISEFGKRVQKGEATAQEVRDHFQYMLDHEAEIKQSIMDYINSNDKYKRKRKDTKEKLVNDTFDRELERLAYAGSDVMRYDPFSGDPRQNLINAVRQNLE